jgi:hypothetical protein
MAIRGYAIASSGDAQKAEQDFRSGASATQAASAGDQKVGMA